MGRTVETYEQAIEYLFGRINYERALADSYSAGDFKLDRMQRLLEAIGSPQRGLPVVHVAGTKGKGSTAVMAAGILAASGCRTGLFTSPHVTAFEERMMVDGTPASPEEIVDLVNDLADPVAAMDRMPGNMNPTYFELATAMGWLHFRRRQVQLAVLEVGVGGRLDATNLCEPEVCLITSISRDHTSLLGSTTPQIAREKAGIVKPGVPVVSGVGQEEARRVIEDVCRRQEAPLLRLGREVRFAPSALPSPSAAPAFRTVDVETPRRAWTSVPVPLEGEHQASNAALAVAAVDLLAERGWPIPEAAVHSGLAGVRWPVRIEVVMRRPTVVLDAAHNRASMAALLTTLSDRFPARRRILVFATTKDKDVPGLLRQAFPEFDTVILTQYLNNPRAVPAEELHRLARTLSPEPAHMAPDPATAWKLARRLAADDDLICATGSFFLAAEMRELILDERRLLARPRAPTKETSAGAAGRA